MSRSTLPSRARRHGSAAFAAVTVVVCIAIFTAAVLVPAPPAVLPFAALICVGCPMLAAWGLAPPRTRAADAALSEFRRSLAALPETKHPLGL